MAYKQITREMIELCLDDELNEMHDPKEFLKLGRKKVGVPFAQTIKQKEPLRYEEYVLEYCKKEGIVIKTFGNGDKIYFEPSEE